MKLGLLSICVALMLSCVLSFFSTVKARHMGLNPHAIHSSVQPDLHHKNEEQSFFQGAYVRRGSKMKKGLSVASSENKPSATEFKVFVQDTPGHNRAHKIKGPETLASNDDGTQIFSRQRKKSVNKSAPAKKKDIAVMAFTPSSSGHSPGIGHDNPPDPRL